MPDARASSPHSQDALTWNANNSSNDVTDSLAHGARACVWLQLTLFPRSETRRKTRVRMSDVADAALNRKKRQEISLSNLFPPPSNRKPKPMNLQLSTSTYRPIVAIKDQAAAEDLGKGELLTGPRACLDVTRDVIERCAQAAASVV